MVKEIKMTGQRRTVSGTSTARRLRRQGLLPGVVNNEKGEAASIQFNAHEFEQMLHHHRSENLLIDLDVDGGAPKKVLLREVQHDPVDGHALHADFVEVSMARKMRVAIQVRLLGEPVGVSQEGGVLEQVLREVHVDCLPGDIVESIDVDVSGLKMGQSLLVRDLKVDPKLTVVTAGGIALANVAAPRKEEEVAATEAVATEGAEPEVITAKKEKEEGAEAETEAEGKEKPKEKGKEAKEGKEAKPGKEGKK